MAFLSLIWLQPILNFSSHLFSILHYYVVMVLVSDMLYGRYLQHSVNHKNDYDHIQSNTSFQSVHRGHHHHAIHQRKILSFSFFIFLMRFPFFKYCNVNHPPICMIHSTLVENGMSSSSTTVLSFFLALNVATHKLLR